MPKVVPLPNARQQQREPEVISIPFAKVRIWYRRAKLCAILAIVLVPLGYGLFRGLVFFQNWQEARQCLALADNVETNVLDYRGERLTAAVIGNRARQIQGSANFLQKLCQAAFAQHWNKPLEKSFPNFSGMAKWWTNTPQSRSGWNRSLAIADDELWDWVWNGLLPSRVPIIPQEYTFYHTTPAPEWWKKQNKIFCDKQHLSGKYGHDYCYPLLPMQHI